MLLDSKFESLLKKWNCHWGIIILLYYKECFEIRTDARMRFSAVRERAKVDLYENAKRE